MSRKEIQYLEKPTIITIHMLQDRVKNKTQSYWATAR